MKFKKYAFILSVLLLFLWACMPKPEIVPVKVKAEPGPEDALFLEAQKLTQEGAYDEALTLYKEYLARYPGRAAAEAALMNMGAIYSAKDQTTQSRKAYRYLVETYPDSSFAPDATVQILMSLYNEGKYNELIKEAEKVPEGLPAEYKLRMDVLMGNAYLASGFPADAVYFYTKAYEKAEGFEKDALAEKLENTAGQLSSTDTTALLNMLREKPSESCYLYGLGVVFHETGKDGSALSALSEFIRRCPDRENKVKAELLIDEINRQTAEYELDTIGCALPLSGAYKVYGEKALKGIEFALAQFSSQSKYTDIKILVKDTGSNPEKTVRAIKELARENAAAVIGPLVEAKLAALEAQDRGLPLIALTQKDDIAVQGEFIFRNFFSPSMQVEVIVSYAMGKLRLKKFAILYPEENYGSVFMNLFWDEVTANGGTITGVESYDVSQTDFTDPVKKLVGLYYDVPRPKRNPENEDPEPIIDFEALFIPEAPKKAALIMPQLAYYDVENVRVFGTNLWHSRQLIELADRYVQGAIMVDGFFAESNSTQVRDFVGAFEETYGETPGFIEAVAYDTAMMLFGLVSRPDIGSRSELMYELKKVKNYNGVTGNTSFDETGEVKKTFYLLQIKGKKFIEIDD